jgi:hypothetical protein
MRTTPADGARLVHQLQGVKFGCHGTGALYGKKTIACFTDAVTKILRWTLSPDSCHRQGSSLARSLARVLLPTGSVMQLPRSSPKRRSLLR